MRAVLACLPCERPDHRTAALARRATGGASPSPEPGADAGPRRRRRRLDQIWLDSAVQRGCCAVAARPPSADVRRGPPTALRHGRARIAARADATASSMWHDRSPALRPLEGCARLLACATLVLGASTVAFLCRPGRRCAVLWSGSGGDVDGSCTWRFRVSYVDG